MRLDVQYHLIPGVHIRSVLGVSSVHTCPFCFVLDGVKVCHRHVLGAHGPVLLAAELDVLGHPLVLVEGALQTLFIVSVIDSDYAFL